MGWLVADDKVLATLKIADTWKTRLKGVLGREGFEGALLIKPAFSVHSIGLKTELDVAYCDANLRVLDIIPIAIIWISVMLMMNNMTIASNISIR